MRIWRAIPGATRSQHDLFDTVDGPLVARPREVLEPECSWLNVGCGTHYADGWVNTDPMVQIDGEHGDTLPDIQTAEFPFRDGWFGRIYLGHVMEHIDWWKLPAWLAEIRRILVDGGQVMATGPDVLRTLEGWKEDVLPWSLVESVLEHRDRESPEWPGSAHQWNCHQARMVGALEAAGFVVETLRVGDVEVFAGLNRWPVKNWSGWQCAMTARKAG